MLKPVGGIDFDKPTTIINTTSQDFTCTYDTHGTGNPISYTIKSRESGTFPYKVAVHIAKHLAKHIVGKKSGVITQAAKEEVYNSLFI